MSPAREAATGRIGLRALGGAFGTPRFGDHETVVAVAGCDLIRRSVLGGEHVPITTLRDAAAWIGVEIDASRVERFDVPVAGDLDEALAVDEEASRWLAS